MKLAKAVRNEVWISLPALVAWLRDAFTPMAVCGSCENRGRVPCDDCTGRGRAACECDCGQLVHEIACEACDGGSLTCPECEAGGPRIQVAKIIGIEVDRNLVLARLEAEKTTGEILAFARPSGRSLRIAGRRESFVVVLPPVRAGRYAIIEEAREWPHEQLPIRFFDAAKAG